MPRSWLDPPRQTFEGGPKGTSLALGLDPPRPDQAWAYLAERALALLGAASLAAENASQAAGGSGAVLKGLLDAWTYASVSLPRDAFVAHLAGVVAANREEYKEAEAIDLRSVDTEGRDGTARSPAHLEALLFSLVAAALPSASRVLRAPPLDRRAVAQTVATVRATAALLTAVARLNQAAACC